MSAPGRQWLSDTATIAAARSGQYGVLHVDPSPGVPTTFCTVELFEGTDRVAVITATTNHVETRLWLEGRVRVAVAGTGGVWWIPELKR